MNPSNANDRYGSSLERAPGAGKPVDPATRLSELLAQSLEELTRPFDPPRPGAESAAAPSEEAAVRPAGALPVEHEAAGEGEPGATSTPENPRMDPALAELEAELFAAAKEVDTETAASEAQSANEKLAAHAEDFSDELRMSLDGGPVHEELHQAAAAAPAVVPPSPLVASETAPEIDGDAARVIAKVRRLMLVSMAVTLIAVGSVFGFIGYRVYKNGGTIEKKADKLPESASVAADVTLSLPRGARILQSAVSNDRLVMTLEIDGKIEVRTFDVKTLQPSGRLNFSATP